jgi:hypothetical protein
MPGLGRWTGRTKRISCALLASFKGGRMRFMRTVIGCAIAALVAGCAAPPWQPEPEPKPATKPAPPPTPQQVNEALTRLNRAFQDAYERILDERGSRTDVAPRAIAFGALDSALRRLGMIAESRDPDAGTLTVAAPAPAPLSLDEWRRVVQDDGPMMMRILCPTLGEYCRQIRFEPEDYVIVINAIVLGAANNGSRISLTARMREIRPRPGVPRRDYPPPTGVRMALDKIWAEYERERAAQARR